MEEGRFIVRHAENGSNAHQLEHGADKKAVAEEGVDHVWKLWKMSVFSERIFRAFNIPSWTSIVSLSVSQSMQVEPETMEREGNDITIELDMNNNWKWKRPEGSW